MIEQYTSPAVVNNSQEPWLVGEGVSLSGSIAIPSLDFNFVTNAFPGTVTFSRASSATLFDSSGTLVYAPMNLLLQSEDLSTTWSLADGTVTANSWTVPTGSATGDTYTVGTSAVVPSQNVTVANSTTYTLSFYYDKTLTTAAFFRLRFGVDGSSVSAWVDAANNTFGSLGAQLSGGVVTDVGNNIYRVSLQIAYGATDGGSRSVAIAGVGGNNSTTADTGNDLAIWGAQFNQTPMQGGVTADLSTYYPTTSAAYQGPRLDYDPATLAARGLLIEEQRTNSIRNNTMQGAVAGTPGTAPTNWAVPSPSTGLSAEIIGTGVEAGITYIDVRYFGTATGTNVIIAFETNTQIAALNGQTWTNSVWVKVISGAANNYTLRTSLRDSGGAGLGQIDTLFAPTSTLTRFFNTGTLADPSVAFVVPQLRFGLTTGVAYDITLRIGLPQLELGAFATSVIPTTTTALTRSADVASVNTLSPWYRADEGTILVEASPQASNVAAFVFVDFNDATTTNRISPAKAITSGNANLFVNYTGATQCNISSAAWTATGKLAGAYKVDDFATSYNGATPATDTTGTVPSVTQMQIGVRVDGGSQLTGHIRRITYYPRRLSNAELQAITA